MEILHWENHNSETFNIFIRDLSLNLNANLKYMIEDLNKKENPKQSKRKSKNLVLKKKDIIINEQNKKRENKREEDDLITMDFLFRNLTNENIYDNFEKLKTERGKQIYKFKLLCYFIKKQNEKKKDYISYILNLYFNLKYGKNEYLLKYKEYQKKIGILDKRLLDYDYKSYMMKELGHLLPPLNFWDKGELKLDDCIYRFIESGKPFIGICLGLQLLFDNSEEFGNHSGLGLIRGVVKKFQFSIDEDTKYPVPQIGWNKIRCNGAAWNKTLLFYILKFLPLSNYFIVL